MMKPQHFCIFLTLSFLVSFYSQARITIVCAGTAGHRIQDLIREGNLRRILHQPLFPESSSPPPSSLPPPPPPPTDPDQPFFPEVPTGRTPDQVQQTPPVPANGTAVTNPVATPAQQTTPAKKVAIAISVGIVTLGMLSALAFYLYKHRAKHPGESQKLVPVNSQRINEESRMPGPPSTFLYIGTVEPSTQVSLPETNGASASPYRKLNSIKRSERYRPSPDLQPLPPLTKPPPPPAINSPPPMSSSDEESHDIAFYTPQGSSVSNEEGSYTPGSHLIQQSNSTSLVTQSRAETQVNTSVPHSKRTSSKSRLYASSSPDVRPAVIPSIKQLPAPPPPSPPPATDTPELSGHQSPVKLDNKPAIPYTPKRPKFSSPPPPPDIRRLQQISNQGQATTKPPLPPPPPPPPPLLTTPRKVGASEMSTPSTASRKLIIPKSVSPRAKTTEIEKTGSEEEFNRGADPSKSHDGDDLEGLKPKLKPLHWDKVRATSDRATVWDQLKSSSFQLNEDMMESLFGCNSGNSVPKDATRKSVLPPVEQENRVLDPKKSQNIAILLRALNVTRDEVSDALLDGNPDGLGPELLETLVKMAPTKEEEIKLRNYDGEISRLGSAERFLKAILDVPFAFRRVEAMLYRANFDSEVNYLRKSFQTLKEASQELKDSRLFLKLLEAVLRTGNRMNVGTNRGGARAFKLDTLLKLVDVKGTDGKTTLLHFVVQEIIRSEGASSETTNETNVRLNEDDFKKQGLQVVAGLSKELGNVRKAAAMDSDVLSSYVSKLEIGLEKVRLVLQYQKPDMQGKFFLGIKNFLKEAEDEIVRIKDEEKSGLSSVKEVTEYFHGDAAKEEAHPLRIFMIVRDFLSILDNVCKEVGRLQDRSMVMGTGRSFRIPATASLPVLSRYNGRHDRSSDDDSSSS